MPATAETDQIMKLRRFGVVVVRPCQCIYLLVIPPIRERLFEVIAEVEVMESEEYG